MSINIALGTDDVLVSLFLFHSMIRTPIFPTLVQVKLNVQLTA